MSSDKQEESPEQQRDEILKLAEQNGCTIDGWSGRVRSRLGIPSVGHITATADRLRSSRYL
uniref:hypothetical protein n=1 Tax=Rubripirellula lacrimiformis TaxID=1930273 RepID=UPI0011AA0B81